MRQTSTALVSIGLALAALVAANAAAVAKPRHHHHYRHLAHNYRHVAHNNGAMNSVERAPLTVNKRSWLDPGPLAPVGSTGPDYVAEGTYFSQTPDEQYFPSRFHEDAMPRPLYVPGTMTPLFTFSTPRDPF
ncbi:hypothetical protein [Methylovirgula sp. HY1]|uniref:hypothetical protein n=1 Tax=Methylovirgula sp. HY1 TaxID=2822761 RepID=UPI001C5AE5A6|nr:hypothetical protein [Methylovirgula sp. HY1]QXX75525.1 hypothetical protein MHY1_02346 [Methylovirgula sp. HY1]